MDIKTSMLFFSSSTRYCDGDFRRSRRAEPTTSVLLEASAHSEVGRQDGDKGGVMGVFCLCLWIADEAVLDLLEAGDSERSNGHRKSLGVGRWQHQAVSERNSQERRMRTDHP